MRLWEPEPFNSFSVQQKQWHKWGGKARRGWVREGTVIREQRTYLGLPSSGVPDLKGKQEHSQQRTQVQNTGIRLVADWFRTEAFRMETQSGERDGKSSSNTAFTLCFDCAVWVWHVAVKRKPDIWNKIFLILCKLGMTWKIQTIGSNDFCS